MGMGGRGVGIPYTPIQAKDILTSIGGSVCYATPYSRSPDLPPGKQYCLCTIIGGRGGGGGGRKLNFTSDTKQKLSLIISSIASIYCLQFNPALVKYLKYVCLCYVLLCSCACYVMLLVLNLVLV